MINRRHLTKIRRKPKKDKARELIQAAQRYAEGIKAKAETQCHLIDRLVSTVRAGARFNDLPYEMSAFQRKNIEEREQYRAISVIVHHLVQENLLKVESVYDQNRKETRTDYTLYALNPRNFNKLNREGDHPHHDL